MKYRALLKKKIYTLEIISGSIQVGEKINGGLYGEYPSLAPDKLLEGDLHFNNDFRSIYSTLLENWMELDAQPIINGNFEKFAFI